MQLRQELIVANECAQAVQCMHGIDEGLISGKVVRAIIAKMHRASANDMLPPIDIGGNDYPRTSLTRIMKTRSIEADENVDRFGRGEGEGQEPSRFCVTVSCELRLRVCKVIEFPRDVLHARDRDVQPVLKVTPILQTQAIIWQEVWLHASPFLMHMFNNKHGITLQRDKPMWRNAFAVRPIREPQAQGVELRKGVRLRNSGRGFK